MILGTDFYALYVVLNVKILLLLCLSGAVESDTVQGHSGEAEHLDRELLPRVSTEGPGQPHPHHRHPGQHGQNSQEARGQRLVSLQRSPLTLSLVHHPRKYSAF